MKGDGDELKGQVVVVYGAAGWVGSAVARAFADAGAQVVLVGRTAGPLEALAAELSAAGTRCLDLRDTSAVAEHMRECVAELGRVDVVFNAVTYDDLQGQSLAEMDLGEFVGRMDNTVRAQYGVAQAAAEAMIPRGRGVILSVVGHGNPFPQMGTTAVSWGLVEAMLAQWAADLGPHGIRVAWLRTTGFAEAITGNRDYGSSYAGDAEAQEILAEIEATTLLGRVPSVAEAGRAAVYLASAEGITAGAINLTAGATAD